MSKTPAKDTPDPTEHRITTSDTPDSYVAQGGTVTAECTCGWTESERYERDRFIPGVRRNLRARHDTIRKGGGS
jgi:hypothetical protein